MKYTVLIRRQKDSNSKPYTESFSYESDGNESVAAMLENLNLNSEDRIEWQCSCLQKKCGACAMVINKVPRLACSTFLRDLGRKIRLEPLSRFPVVRDLIVNREPVFEQLKERRLWAEKNIPGYAADHDRKFKAAACIMCGCCLEVCPNFAVSLNHLGAVGAAASYRLGVYEENAEHKDEIRAAYIDTLYNTCGKSLSCLNICPVNVPIEELMVKNPAI